MKKTYKVLYLALASGTKADRRRVGGINPDVDGGNGAAFHHSGVAVRESSHELVGAIHVFVVPSARTEGTSLYLLPKETTGHFRCEDS